MAAVHVATYGPNVILTATTSTSSVTCAVGDVLVVWAASNNASNVIATPSGGGLTWTLQKGTTNAATGSAGAWVWTATAASAQTFTLSMGSTTSGSQWAWGVERFSGVTSIGASALQEATTTASPSVTLTTGSANSAIIMVVGDWNGVSPTGATFTTASAGAFSSTATLTSSTHLTAYAGYYADAGTAGSETVGMSAPTGQQPSTVAVELVTAATGGGGTVSLVDTVPFSDGTTTGGTSTTGTIPSATAAVGDTAIFIMCENGGSVTFTAPTGWSTVSGPSTSGTTQHTQVFGKDLVSGDIGSSITFSSSGSGTRTIGVLAIYRGTSLASITAGTPTVNGTATTSITSPTVTTTVANSWVVGLWAVRVATAAPSPTLSYPGTETFDNRSRSAFTASPNYTAEISHLTTPGAAGSYGGITATASASTTSQHAFTLVVPPAGTGGQSGTATAAGAGTAAIITLITHPYVETAAGVGTATVTGRVTKIDGTLAPAGVGSATVTGTTTGGSATAIAAGVGAASVAAAGGTSQISFVGSATAQTPIETPPATTSIVSALPTGIQTNDLILLAVHRSQDYAIASTPTGYTSLDTVVDTGTSPTATATDIYYRFADGTESTTGPTFSVATATRFIAHAAVYRGVDTTTPFVAHGGQATATSTANRAAPALTNTNTNAWGVYATALRQLASPVTFTPPTGLTERQDTDIGVTTTTDLAAEWADTAAVVGSTGSITYTGTSSGATSIATAWAAFLKPAATTGPTAGAPSAAGVGTATISGFASHSPTIAPLAGAGVGSATADGFASHSPTIAPLAPAGVGSASVAGIRGLIGADTAAGVGAASLAGLVTKIDGVLRPAGVGAATVIGLGTLVAPSHVTTQATIAFDGIATASLLVVPPGVATLASDGQSDAELASDGTSTATVLAVPPGVATIQTT